MPPPIIFSSIVYFKKMSVKERVELERQQAIRDILLKRDVARWLQAKMLQIEQGLGTEPQNKVQMLQIEQGLSTEPQNKVQMLQVE